MSDLSSAPASAVGSPAPSRHLRRTVDLTGYRIDTETLSRLDAMAIALVTATGHPTTNVRVDYRCALEKGGRLTFDSLAALQHYLRENPTRIRTLQSSHEVEESAAIAISYRLDGEVDITAYGSSADFEFRIDRITEELRRTVEELPWWVRNLLHRAMPLRLLRVTAAFSSVILLLLSGMYAYGLRYGINIDPAVAETVPYGLTYKSAVAEALKSPDVNRKLDVLLYGQLQDFTPVDIWLEKTRRQLGFLLVSLLGSLGLLALARKLTPLYPRAFFHLSSGVEQFAAMQRNRDFWEGAVLVAFAVNVIAGLLLTLFA